MARRKKRGLLSVRRARVCMCGISDDRSRGTLSAGGGGRGRRRRRGEGGNVSCVCVLRANLPARHRRRLLPPSTDDFVATGGSQANHDTHYLQTGKTLVTGKLLRALAIETLQHQ